MGMGKRKLTNLELLMAAWSKCLEYEAGKDYKASGAIYDNLLRYIADDLRHYLSGADAIVWPTVLQQNGRYFLLLSVYALHFPPYTTSLLTPAPSIHIVIAASRSYRIPSGIRRWLKLQPPNYLRYRAKNYGVLPEGCYED